jgi:hypothetical protein
MMYGCERNENAYYATRNTKGEATNEWCLNYKRNSKLLLRVTSGVVRVSKSVRVFSRSGG